MAADPAKLAWALKASIARWARDTSPPAATAADPIVDVLLGLDPGRLDAKLRRLRLILLADALTQSGRRAELRAVVAKAPAADRPPEVRIWLESARMTDLQAAIGRRDAAGAANAWEELIRSDASGTLKRQVTARVDAMVAAAAGLGPGWRRRLEAASHALGDAPDAAMIREAIGKVDERIKAAVAR